MFKTLFLNLVLLRVFPGINRFDVNLIRDVSSLIIGNVENEMQSVLIYAVVSEFEQMYEKRKKENLFSKFKKVVF